MIHFLQHWGWLLSLPFAVGLVVDYLPVATGGGANVDTQGNFNGSGYQTQGFTTGVAQSIQMNKVWRQASMVAAALANFVANMLQINVLDDGNIANLITNLTNAIRSAAGKLVAVAFSATPVFDASLGNIFEITLTGNVTSSSLINLTAIPGGQRIVFIIHQDGVGGRAFVPPPNVPMDGIDTTLSKTSVQSFVVAANQTSVYADGPMIGGQ